VALARALADLPPRAAPVATTGLYREYVRSYHGGRLDEMTQAHRDAAHDARKAGGLFYIRSMVVGKMRAHGIALPAGVKSAAAEIARVLALDNGWCPCGCGSFWQPLAGAGIGTVADHEHRDGIHGVLRAFVCNNANVAIAARERYVTWLDMVVARSGPIPETWKRGYETEHARRARRPRARSSGEGRKGRRVRSAA
jgi:hypothetical protein